MAKDIHEAAEDGSLQEVKRFLERGVPVDDVDDEGATPLGRAARFDHRGIKVAKSSLCNLGAGI